MKKHVVLVIIDGWGIGPKYEGNAIIKANTPVMDKLWTSFPHTQLVASGESVGLPKGEDGNTETGHLNIGAGKIVYQDLPRINTSIAGGGFFSNEAFLKTKAHVVENNSNLHLIGLIGSGGVHSSNQHLFALLQLCKQQHVENVYLHLFTDGRDSPPTSANTYLEQIQQHMEELQTGKISTIIGRYYAMDRDRRWDRTKIAYDALVNGIGTPIANISEAIKQSYDTGKTDEFILPIFPQVNGNTLPRIASNDAVIFFNYRVDRPRQLTRVLTLSDKDIITLQESFDPYATKYYKSHLKKPTSTTPFFARTNKPNNLLFITMTQYEKGLPVEVAYPPEFVKMPLSRVIALSGKRQLKLSESEKERFVTYYFNGQREQKFPGEDVDITPSPLIATYDLKPEMSGAEQTKKLLNAIKQGIYDLIIINYANPDMVAHTGDLKATIKACEYTDTWIGMIYNAIITRDDVVLVITSDHGNAEEVINLETGQIDTEHSNFPVPFIIAGKHYYGKRGVLPQGILGDVAPTILKLMQIQAPSTMSGRSLI